MAKLGLSDGPASNNIDQANGGERVEAEIRGRLWSLCQTRIQVDPMAKTANNTRAAAVNEEPTYGGGHLPLVLYGETTDDMGDSQGYLDDHNGQVVRLEASSDVPRHLQVDLFEGEDSEFIYSQHIHSGMFGEVPENIHGGDESEYLIDYPPRVSFSTTHNDLWAEREPHAHLLEGPPETNSLVYHLGEGELLEEGSEDFELSEEDHLLTIAGDHPFIMTTTNDTFQDDDYQYHPSLDFPDDDIEDEENMEEEDGYEYHHALELLQDDVENEEDVEEEEDGFIYTDGQGNCYTFEPHDAISEEEGLTDNVHHLGSLQHAPTEVD